MDKRELLKSVLQNFINDKPDEAKADFHQYLTLKSKEITGIGASPAAQENQTEVDTQTDAATAASSTESSVADQSQTASEEDQAAAVAAVATETTETE